MTDPGAGLALAGWGCNCPPYAVTGDCSGTRERTRVRSEDDEDDGDDETKTEPREPGPNPGDCVTPCKETGSLIVGTQERRDPLVCVGESITFVAPNVSDTGGTKEEICRNEDGSLSRRDIPVPAGTIRYTWLILLNSVPVATGSGPLAGMIAQEEGTYLCIFTATTSRDCSPEPMVLPPQQGQAIRINIAMQGLAEENASGSNQPHETEPGALIFVNHNDDDGVEGIDNLHTTPLTKEDPSLERFTISINPVPDEGTVTLTIPPGTRVWADAMKNPTPTTWNVAQTRLPDELFLEGTATGAGNLVVTFSGETTCSDQVRLEVFLLELLIGAENQQDMEVFDDWVGAEGHSILNFIKLQGPSERDITIDLSSAAMKDPDDPGNPDSVSEGTITIIHRQFKLSTSRTADADRAFELRGENPSRFENDIAVVAKHNGKEVTRETLSVLKFRFSETTDGGGFIPLNPAFVNEVEHTIGGNLFGPANNAPGQGISVSDGHFVQFGLGAASRKLRQDKIELLWARRLNGQVRDSDQDTGLVFQGLMAVDKQRPAISNFRLRDTSVPAGLSRGTELTYFLGHRTSKHPFMQVIQVNNVGSISAKYQPHVTLPVVVHIVSPAGGVNKTTAAQAATFMTQVNEIYTQAAISFNVLATPLDVTPIALLTPTTDTFGPFGFGEASTLSVVNPDNGGPTDAIDIYLVNNLFDGQTKAGDSLNGLTILRSQKGPISGEPAVFVSGFPSPDPQATRDALTLPRTIAHEIGHYLDNTATHTPDEEVWSLMHEGGDTDQPQFKRDITEAEATRFRARTTTANIDG